MKHHTLVIDDDKIVLFMIRKLIETTQFCPDALFYEKPDIALGHFEEVYNPKDRFIIFLDINMPEINAWDFLDRLKNFTEVYNTLVIIITSSTSQEDKEKAEANPYVQKLLIKPVLRKNIIELKEELKPGTINSKQS